MRRNPPLPFVPLKHAYGMRILPGITPRPQRTAWTCGPACIRMIFEFHGKRITERVAAREMGTTPKHGTVPQAMINLLSRVCRPVGGRLTRRDVRRLLSRGIPVLVLWDDWQGHWAVAISADDKHILLADPANSVSGLRLHTWRTFCDHWTTTVADTAYRNYGIACS